MVQITLTETRQIKNPNTKTTYTNESIEIREIDAQQYNRIVSDDTCKWFRRLGGSETKTMGYTSNGYCCTQLISKSPDRSIKVIRKFNFKWID
jgi:hypothetical protein